MDASTTRRPKVVVPEEFTAVAGLHAKLGSAGYTLTVTPRTQERPWTPDEIRDFFADADVIISTPTQPFPAEVLRAARNLTMIGSAVIGVDHIDVDAATELGIIVSNCPTRETVVGMAEASAMFMLALLLQLE